MRYEVFRSVWEEALRDARLLTFHDRPTETLALEDMSRAHRVRVGVFDDQPADPFTASMELSWKWDALQTARTETTEEDLLTTLFGRDGADADDTARPWLRIDVVLHGKVHEGTRLPAPEPQTWRTWVADVARNVHPLLAPQADEPGHEQVVESWLGEPEAHLRCESTGQLWLLGVQLEAWQGIYLPRQRDLGDDQRADESPEEQLAVFAQGLRRALDGWKRSLKSLLPPVRSVH